MRRRTFLALTPGLLAGCVSTDARPSGPRLPPRSPEGGSASGSGSGSGDGGGDDGGGGNGDGGNGGGASSLEIATFDIKEGAEGNLVVPVTIANNTAEERSAVVVVEADVDGETYEARREVTVAADSKTSISFTLEVSYEAFVSGGDLSVDLEN